MKKSWVRKILCTTLAVIFLMLPAAAFAAEEADLQQQLLLHLLLAKHLLQAVHLWHLLLKLQLFLWSLSEPHNLLDSEGWLYLILLLPLQ
jgi:hypothetical protein